MKTDKRFWVIAGAYDDKEQAVNVMRKLDTVVREVAVLDMDQRQDAGLRALTDAVLLLTEQQEKMSQTIAGAVVNMVDLAGYLKKERMQGTQDDRPEDGPPEDDPRERPLARLLRDRLDSLGLSQWEVAKRSGDFTQNALSRWCRGGLPTRGYLHAIADALDVPYKTLLDAYNRSIVR